MDCDDCMKIMCMYRGKRKNCTEIVRLRDMNTEKIDMESKINKLKEEGYLDFEGMR